MYQYGMTRKDAQDCTGEPKPTNITIVNKETQTWELPKTVSGLTKKIKDKHPMYLRPPPFIL